VCPEAVEHHAQELGPGRDVFLGVEGIGHAQGGLGVGHELHQALGALGRDGPGLEPRFLLHHRVQQFQRHLVGLAVAFDHLHQRSGGDHRPEGPRSPAARPLEVRAIGLDRVGDPVLAARLGGSALLPHEPFDLGEPEFGIGRASKSSTSRSDVLAWDKCTMPYSSSKP
jgi:hypothetical protein